MLSIFRTKKRKRIFLIKHLLSFADEVVRDVLYIKNNKYLKYGNSEEIHNNYGLDLKIISKFTDKKK